MTTRLNFLHNIGLKKLAFNTGKLLPVILVLFSPSQPTSADEVQPNNTPAAAISTLIAEKQNSLLIKPDFSKQADQLLSLYQLANNQFLWLGDSQSQTNIDAALAILTNAGADGLDPRDYDADVLKQTFELATAIPPSAINELAKFDTALSIALLRFVNDLHHGRVNPQQLNYPSPFGSKQFIEAAHLIKQAIDQHSVAQLPEAAQPKYKQYQQLKQILADYRKAPADGNFEPLIFEKALRPGEHHPQLDELRQRLITLNAMTPETADLQPEKFYSKKLQAGVKEFQRQNNLQADGIIGKETAAKLNQSLEQKILQIELAMERLRWLPDDITGPVIIVNIPAFQLRAFNSVNEADILSMKVIVGKAEKNQTPVLLEDMKYLEFMPYWNIPSSIMKKEILPKMYNNLGYLQSQDIELVQLYSKQDSGWYSVFDDIKHGRVRARQRPGKKNPLGKVKFIFPNKEDVYLHDTSSPSLFNRNQRDLSHGCVRVAEAEKLAEFVLGNQPETNWDLAAIQQAMSGSKTRRVSLSNPIPVLFFYTTTFVDQDNQIHFYRDIYNQDEVLEKALGRMPFPDNSSLVTAKTTTSG
ncbi:L,D-transpeptidase family protein [Methylomonas lenta]|uniref:L,D-transpeptidase family protein n=1 Tax=Methylomonas lenta TaxID=980561 RepID=UPI000B27A550|nr:L,D-transpeptidase family protein [Methylomonas lenta]